MPYRKKEIIGIVVPAGWNEAGNVTGAALQAFDENEYIIEYDAPDRLLRDWLHKSVAVTGKIRERLDGKKLIRISSIQPVASGNLQPLHSE